MSSEYVRLLNVFECFCLLWGDFTRWKETLHFRHENKAFLIACVCAKTLQSCPTLCDSTHWQAPLSMGFSRQEYWSGLPCPSPRDLPNTGIKPVSLMSSALAGRLFITNATYVTISNKLVLGRINHMALKYFTRNRLFSGHFVLTIYALLVYIAVWIWKILGEVILGLWTSAWYLLSSYDEPGPVLDMGRRFSGEQGAFILRSSEIWPFWHTG